MREFSVLAEPKLISCGACTKSLDCRRTVCYCCVFIYSLVYAGLIPYILAENATFFSLDTFGSLDSIAKAFALREVVLLGWVHYVTTQPHYHFIWASAPILCCLCTPLIK